MDTKREGWNYWFCLEEKQTMETDVFVVLGDKVRVKAQGKKKTRMRR
jgi:hypothetical protein